MRSHRWSPRTSTAPGAPHTHARRALTLLAALLIALASALAHDAAAQDPGAPAADAPDGVWIVTSFTARGVDAGTTETFRDLLQGELSRELDIVPVRSATACDDAPCAIAVGQDQGGDVVIYGSLSTLGSKIIVNTTAVHVVDGRVLNSQRMSVDRVEELDIAARRLARAIVRGEQIEDNAELGSITQQEVAPPPRRRGDSGASLRVGGMVPLGDNYGNQGFGMAFDVGYWFEAPAFAIEPRLGVRFDVVDDEATYIEVPLDVGAYFIPGLGDFTPFIGGGFGARYIYESRQVTLRTGEVLTTVAQTEREDSGWGMGMFARVGMLFFRTYEVRVALTLDYNLTIAEINDRNTLQALTFGMNVIF